MDKEMQQVNAAVEAEQKSAHKMKLDKKRVAEAYGFPGRNIMVACTHNHAGPATSELAPVKRDEKYNEHLTRCCVDAFGTALVAPQPRQLSCPGHR